MSIRIVILCESTRFKREGKQVIMPDIFEHVKRVILSREERTLVNADWCIGESTLKFGKSPVYYTRRDE